MDLPTLSADGTEPPPLDEEAQKLKDEQFKKYADFAGRHKKIIDDVSSALQEYKGYKEAALQNLVQLRPLVVDPEQERLKREAAERKQKEDAQKQEEAKKAAEAAAAAAPKGGKK